MYQFQIAPLIWQYLLNTTSKRITLKNIRHLIISKPANKIVLWSLDLLLVWTERLVILDNQQSDPFWFIMPSRKLIYCLVCNPNWLMDRVSYSSWQNLTLSLHIGTQLFVLVSDKLSQNEPLCNCENKIRPPHFWSRAPFFFKRKKNCCNEFKWQGKKKARFDKLVWLSSH